MWSGDRSSHNAFFRTVVISAVEVDDTSGGFKGVNRASLEVFRTYIFLIFGEKLIIHSL